MRKCGDVSVDYVYHLGVASIQYSERHVVCLTTRHIMMIDTDQFQVIWKERLEHVKSFNVFRTEITLKIDRSVQDFNAVRRGLRRRDGRSLRRFGSSRIEELREEESRGALESGSSLKLDLESGSTKRFADIQIEEEESQTDVSEKRRFACKQLDEVDDQEGYAGNLQTHRICGTRGCRHT